MAWNFRSTSSRVTGFGTAAAIVDLALEAAAVAGGDGEPRGMAESRAFLLQPLVEMDLDARDEGECPGVRDPVFGIVGDRDVAAQRHDGKPVEHVHLGRGDARRTVIPGCVDEGHAATTDSDRGDVLAGNALFDQHGA